MGVVQQHFRVSSLNSEFADQWLLNSECPFPEPLVRTISINLPCMFIKVKHHNSTKLTLIEDPHNGNYQREGSRCTSARSYKIFILPFSGFEQRWRNRLIHGSTYSTDLKLASFPFYTLSSFGSKT